MANLPRVALIITGGTIDSVGKDRLDLAWYIEAGKRLNDGELLQQLPELKEIAQVQEIPFRRLPSHALIDKDWLDLVRTIHKIFDEDKADGIVITHGTNTIEETAYFLNLTLKTDKPVGDDDAVGFVFVEDLVNRAHEIEPVFVDQRVA